jgi:hypothetical protein
LFSSKLLLPRGKDRGASTNMWVKGFENSIISQSSKSSEHLTPTFSLKATPVGLFSDPARSIPRTLTPHIILTLSSFQIRICEESDKSKKLEVQGSFSKALVC